MTTLSNQSIKLVILGFIWTLSLNSTYGQIAGNNFIPFEVEGIDIDWHHVSYDSTIVALDIEGSPATYDGYSHLHHYYDENRMSLQDENGYLYLIHHSRYDQDGSGALIEKIDIVTGELIWKIIFDLRTIDIREFVFTAKITDDILTLHNIQVTNEYPTPLDFPIILLGWAEGHLKIRQYDIHTGELLFESIPDTTQNLKTIDTHSFNESIMSTLDEGMTEVFKHQWTNDGPYVTIDSINNSGVCINPTDTLWSELGDLNWAASRQNQYQLMSRDQSSDKFYFQDFYIKKPSSLDSTRFNINVYQGSELLDIIEVDFPDKEKVQACSIISISENRILLKVFFFDDSISYLLLDHSGSIVWMVDLPERGPRYVQVNDQDEFVMTVNNGRVNGKSQIEILKLEDGNLVSKGSFSLKDENYLMYDLAIERLPQNKFLITVDYYEDTPSRADGGDHIATFVVDGSEFGIASSTEVVSDNNIELDVFPNPFSDNLTVQSSEDNAQVSLYSMAGELIFSQAINQGTTSLETSNLVDGMYLLKISYQKYQISRPVIKH